MINKIILTVSPIFSILPKSAAAIESWMYNVAKRLDMKTESFVYEMMGIVLILLLISIVKLSIKFGKCIQGYFKKWTRLDPYSYADRIVKLNINFL